MRSVNPYLNFPGNTLEAFNFYKSVFGGEFSALLRFGDMQDDMGMSGEERNLIAHVSLPLMDNVTLMGTDVTPSMPFTLNVGNNMYITLDPESREEAERLFEGLSAGGRVEMAPQETEWAELYGSFADRFGVQWMISYEGNKAQSR